MRIWSAESAETSHDFVKSPFHPEKIVVWPAISRIRIFGPFFFKGPSMPRDIEIIYLNLFTKSFMMMNFCMGIFNRSVLQLTRQGTNLRVLQ
jgi:hypothetical protein